MLDLNASSMHQALQINHRHVFLYCFELFYIYNTIDSRLSYYCPKVSDFHGNFLMRIELNWTYFILYTSWEIHWNILYLIIVLNKCMSLNWINIFQCKSILYSFCSKFLSNLFDVFSKGSLQFFRSPESLRWPIAMGWRPSSCDVRRSLVVMR